MAWTPPSDAIAEQPVKETPGITGWTPPSDAVEVQGAWTPPSDAVLPSISGPTPGLVSFINEPKKPEEKKVFTGSVFDTQPFEPEFDPAEAARLSRRAYAEETTRAPRRVQEMRATPEEQIKRSALRAAGDTAIGVLQGAAAIPKGITDNIPFDNPLSQFYKDAYEAGEKSKSGYLRSKNVERAALLDNIRRNQGELAATRGAFTTMFSPSGADIVAQGAGSMIPALGMSVLNLGTKSMMAMNALANAGDAAQQTAAKLAEMSPEDWSKSSAYQALREQGLDHRDAVRMLAPMYALPSQVIGGITGAVSGGTGLESALVKGAAKSARARAGRAGVELLGEEAETLAPMLAGNVTQRIIDDRTALLGSLGQAAVETAVAAGPGAGLAAAIAAPERRAAPSAERMARERGFLVETPKAEPKTAGGWEVVAEEPAAPATPVAPAEAVAEPAPTAAAPTPVTPVVERMREQQRAVQELEAEPEVTAEPVDPQERYKQLVSRSARMTDMFRDKVITNAEYENFQSQLEEARAAAKAAPTEGLSDAKQELLRLADQIEQLGQKNFAEGMRGRANPKAAEPRESDMDFYRSRLTELQTAKAPTEEAAAPKVYGLKQFFADDQKEIDRLDQQLSGRGRIKFAIEETDNAIQSLYDTIRSSGFDLGQQEIPEGIRKLKSQIGVLAAGASRLSKAQEAIDKGYKRADKNRLKADLDDLRNNIESAYDMIAVEPNRPTAAEEMEGAEVPAGEEIAGLAEQQRKAAEDRGILARRTAGTSLMKVLQGTLKDGELSELAGRARKVGKNPFLNLKAPKGQTGSSMEDMVNSGVLDAFLPDAMRPGAETYDNAEAAEYIREKLRNNEFYTYETELAIERIDQDIEAIERQIQELLTIEDINKEIQRATDEQRELDQAAAELAPEEEAGATEERAGEEEVLKAQTEEELRAKAEREEAAAREEEKTRREEERKAAAPKAEEFVLTGSERAADEAAARGQQTFLNIEPIRAGWTANRIDRLVNMFGYTDGRTYGVAARINPSDFVDATTPGKAGAEQLRAEAEDLDLERLSAETQTPFLEWDFEKNAIVGHEGRHRMEALARAGVKSAPVVLIVRDRYGSKMPQVLEPVHFKYLSGQRFEGGIGKEARLSDLVPLSYEYTDQLNSEYGTGQIVYNVEPVGESVAGDESTRAPSLKRKIKTLNRQREEGKISDQRFINEVDFAVKQDEEQRYKTAPRERVRGADFIRQKLLEAKRRGDLSAEGVDLAEWFILQNEALVDDLGIAIKTPKEGGTAGMYNKLARIMVLMKEASNDSTIVHEILHHLERMMPAEVQAAIRTEWLGSMLRASRQAKTPQEKMFFAALINHHFGSGLASDIKLQGADADKVLDSLIKRGVVEGPRASSYQLAIEMIRSGTIPYDRYQYVNPSEFWAVRGSDIVEGRFKAIKGDVLAKLKNWLKELAQKIKSIFGLRSDAPLIKALDSMAKGDGKFVSKDMLGEGENFLQVGKNIYNRRPLAQWSDPDETKLDDFIYKFIDKNVDTKRVIQSIEKSIGKLDDKWNPYLQEELYHGRTATQTKDFLKFEVRPLLQEMQKENVTIPEIEEYLHNRFAPIRNQNIAKINPEFPDDGTPGSGGSGIDTADAKAYMANLSPEQKAKYEKIAKMVDAITSNTRGYLVATGLEDVDTVMEWEKSSPNYVPLSRGDIDYGRSVGSGTGMGFSVRGPSTRRATGSRREVSDILANIIMQRERAIVRGEKNRVATALYGLAVQNPNPDFWLAVNPDAPSAKKKAVQELVSQGMSQADAEGLMQEPSQKVVDESRNLVTSRINPVLRGADNVLGVRVNGKDRFIYFNTQNPRAVRMAQSLKNLDADQLGSALTAIAKITRYFASINTQYNPIFGVYNFLRDIQGGAIQMAGTPIEDMRSEVLSPKNLVGAMRGIYQTLRAERAGKQQLMTPWANLWIDFQREGGQTGFRDLFSRSQERAAALQSELDAMKEGKLKKAAYAVPRAVRDWLADYNETLENAVRLTAYKAALDKGMSREQAASVAKNLTVNFNRKGQAGVQAGALYAFFNSSMQGTSRLLQTVSKMERPGDIKSLRLTSMGKKVIYGGFLLGVIQAMSMAAMGFDEDEPPEFVKDRNLIIPLPDGKYLAWPMPLGYHVIPAVGRILTEWAISGGKDSGKRVAHLTSLIFDAFSPIGNAGWSLQSIAPTIFDPIAALFENKDWTGKKIAKEDFNKLDPTPGYTRAKQNASWFGKELSYLLNILSGGDKDKPGVVNLTPDQIDYLIGQAAGGLGREVMKASKTAEGLRTGEEIAPYNVPLVGRFYGDTKAGYAESNKFYKNLEEVNILENQLQGRQKRREGDIPEFIKENPKVRLAPAAHSIERNIRQLRKQKEALVEKGAPKEQIKAIENRITLQMKKFNEKIDSLEGKNN